MRNNGLGTFETRLVPNDAKALNIRVAADSESGEFEGYGCVWDVIDAYGTHFVRGCFEEGGLDERAYALLSMHDPTMPGGTFTAREDDHGLWLEGAYDATQLGQDLRTRAKSGSQAELSVGFVWRDSDPDDENAITNARLVETSQITARMAAVPGAQISSVRHAVLHGVELQDTLLVRDGENTLSVQKLAAARAKLLLLG